MPGFDQRGPMNQGPMTGGGRGICTGAGMQGAGMQGAGMQGAGMQGAGAGMARGFGQGRGRRCARGYGRGAGYRWDPPALQPQADADPSELLSRRASYLEQELAAVKKELSDLQGKD